MAKDPAFLFYSQDFFTGVATLTFEERGQFITLLCLMHQKGRMSEETIRFLVGNVSENLKSKFKIDDSGLWYNERLELEASKRSKFTESRRANGSKGGRPKKKEKSTNNLKGNHMVNHMEDENENENENEKLKMQIEGLGENFAAAWVRWKVYRKKKDRFKYLDEQSERSAISKLGNMAGGDPAKAIEIIENSIDNGWKGFFELKTETNGKQNSKGWAAPTIDEVIQYQRDKHGLDI